jgi:outer membrane protein OmpA-like peptidoglycan-associated protein
LHFLTNDKVTPERKITKLEKQVKQISKGDDLAKIFNINMIYFDLDKYNIRPDAAVELNKILVVLQENHAINIQINSHTDSRNTHLYNQTLSQNRAASTMNWLVKNGINKNRLKAVGFGETNLLNNCTDDEICTEEAHQLNRRSEFLIID